jgi:hypothetical protein
MVKSVSHVLGPALLSLVFASTAFADGITITASYPNGILWYTFTATNGNSYTEPVAPYASTTTIDGNTASSSSICMDINNPTQIGKFYSGTFGTAVTLAEVESSWLADQLAGTSAETSLASYTGPISLAIWQIEFSSSNNYEGGIMPIDPAAQIWISEAAAAVANGYQSDSAFFIPDDSSAQRFVEISETTDPGTLDILAPEPGTLGLMGTGLLGLAGILRRKLSR